MALCAHNRNRIKIDHVFVVCPVGPVAAQALHVEILVPWVDILFTDRMRCVLLPFVAGSAELDNRLFKEQEIV